jgi:Holliday junction resolvase RusA-like endonuclease
MDSWAFYAYGTPAPMGSKRHVGRGVMIESSKKVKPWREAVKAAGEGAGPTLDGPLRVVMVFSMPRPKSAPKRVTVPSTMPDLSKLCRATEDAITEVGLWADDARVAQYALLAKAFAGAKYDSFALPFPGVVVACTPVDQMYDLALRLAAGVAAQARSAQATSA